MNTRVRFLPALLLPLLPAFAPASIPSDAVPSVIVSTAREPVTAGPFAPTWDSLRGYEAPEWFRDAKFGIWAHWGPQCEPGRGDWYARHLYFEKGPAWGPNVTAFHRETYGHPSQAGFKDVIHRWKAERWNPDQLVALYKRAGAQYFFALANHHDNLDLWNSKYQPWNSVRVGPQKDLIAGWAKAARANGLKFGVSVHAAHAWSWYEPSQGADKAGPLAGVPYDGKLTAAAGKGTWWEGLDPQDLYEQRHAPAEGFAEPLKIHERWDWGNGITPPDQAYSERFYNRTMDLINRFKPDLLYFDDTALPLWPVSDAGLKIAAHFYNQGTARNGGKPDTVLFGKVLTADQKRAVVWDVERGAPNDIQALPWQTCTCIGSWHYDQKLAAQNRYKSAATVLQMLADIVSKNGNLLLNIPLRGDGTPDDASLAVVEGIAAWMDVNREAIFGTRPWQIFGEGPASAGAALNAQGFNEDKGKPYTADDVRYTQSKDGRTLYVIGLVRPTAPVSVKALGSAASRLDRAIASVELLGSAAPVKWSRTADALVLDAGATTGPAGPVVFKISLR
ncbi:MAG: alpha-L-fucosidase [Verrucomicrobiota bacterium]|nr:alpha-L-fucosidase [Verrucomicrobiota bacterium]